jgi:DNA replication protein DnaC
MLHKLLEQLKMHGAINALDRFREIKDTEEYLLSILNAESEHRQQLATKRRLGGAKFPVAKDWCDIDSSLNPKIDFKAIQKLATGKFVEKKENLCLMGQQGTGKTHSLIALGRQLCRNGISVKFYTGCSLANALEEAKAKATLSKMMKSLLKPKLLLIDELGFVPFSENSARLLFDVFASRYETGSIAVSTNLSFEKWGQIFGSIELTAALVDRFTHRANIFTFEGCSARLIQAKKTNIKKR